MRTLLAALLVLSSLTGISQAQEAREQRVAPGTTGQFDNYPDWAQRAFEPKN
jgi:hypothetical protein